MALTAEKTPASAGVLQGVTELEKLKQSKGAG
jgi:hypothetical protein